MSDANMVHTRESGPDVGLGANAKLFQTFEGIPSSSASGTSLTMTPHPGVELRADLKSIFHRRHLFDVVFVRELIKETIHLPLGCLLGGCSAIIGTYLRISGLGFRVSGLGFRVSGLGFRVSGLGFRASGLGFRVSGLEFRISSLGLRASGLGFRVSG